MAKRSGWDTELYEAQHSFVWKLGEGLLADLNAQPGERILDLGCGTGQLTSAIAATGASVLGLDSSPEMIGQARQNYPLLPFVLQDAYAMEFDGEFDAVFSNASLHWMIDASTVAGRMARALRPGGRLAAEFGGKGNVGQIHGAIEEVVERYAGAPIPTGRTYFPAVGEYASVLEEHGFEVRTAMLLDRPTPLEGPQGMERWIRQFAFDYFDAIEAGDRPQAINAVLARLRPALWRDGVWFADYRRLRIRAVKL